LVKLFPVGKTNCLEAIQDSHFNAPLTTTPRQSCADAEDGSFSAVVTGPDGIQGFDKRFGTSAEAGGFSNLGPGVSAGEYQTGNVEYFTFSGNVAAASAVTASSGGATVSASSVGAQSSSMTFAIDFTTGAIHACSPTCPCRQARRR
jgi:hypothetical protein